MKNMMEMPDSRRPQHGIAAHGLGQTFGILPSLALLALVVDTMLFSGAIATMGLILPFCCSSGVMLGIITYRAQRRFYGDDREAALIKALILGLLTAIPSPLPAMLYVPSGIVGFVHGLRRNKGDD